MYGLLEFETNAEVLRDFETASCFLVLQLLLVHLKTAPLNRNLLKLLQILSPNLIESDSNLHSFLKS
jgi:hypothetical protein